MKLLLLLFPTLVGFASCFVTPPTAPAFQRGATDNRQQTPPDASSLLIRDKQEQSVISSTTSSTTSTILLMISRKRREELGIADDEDEYDLDFALEANTDDTINKVIAGSLIVTLIGLLLAGVIIPSLTEYDEGICNPILTGGRC